MRNRHLSRRPGGTIVFHIRIPKSLDSDLSLAPIRVTLGRVDMRTARRAAALLAAAATLVFARLEEKAAMDRDQAKPDGAEIRRMFVGMLPFLRGLDAIDRPGSDDPDVADRMKRSGLEGLRAVSASLLAPDTSVLPVGELPLLERHYLRVMRDEEAGRQHLGLQRRAERVSPTMAFEQVMSIMKDLQKQNREIGAEVTVVREQTAKPKGPLFSNAGADYYTALEDAHGEDYPELGYILHRTNVFVGIVGDKHIGDIDTEDFQKFVNELAHLPQNFSKRKNYLAADIPAYIADIKKRRAQMKSAGAAIPLNDDDLTAPRLRRSTLRVQYLTKVKTIIRAGCAKANIQVPHWGRVTIPKSAPRPKKRYPIGPAVLNRIFRAGVDSGILSDAMLPPLGLTVGRRLSLLAYMRGDDIVQFGDCWGVIPREVIFENGKIKTTPMKTDESATVWVFNKFFVETGFVEWARKQPGWVFAALHDHIIDPGDTASKRMGRLFHRNGARKDLLQSFHALRGTKIEYDRLLKLDIRVIQKQVGHEFEGVHERYGAPVLTPQEVREVANLPLPDGIDWDMFRGLDFDQLGEARPTVGRPRRRKSKL